MRMTNLNTYGGYIAPDGEYYEFQDEFETHLDLVDEVKPGLIDWDKGFGNRSETSLHNEIQDLGWIRVHVEDQLLSFNVRRPTRRSMATAFKIMKDFMAIKPVLMINRKTWKDNWSGGFRYLRFLVR